MIAAAATVLTLFLAKQAAADEYVLINTAEELAQLATNVYYGTTYSGTTVLLNADLDFDGVSFSPIGIGSDYFHGVFDGQGHTISNLNFLDSGNYVGLFGYSRGTTIRNVVLDSSCSFESTYTSTTYTGGILGYSKTYDRTTTIDNCVNMASVSYKQYSRSTSYLGGIVGYHDYYDYGISITNCANYGSVTRTNTYYYNYIGGIAGYLYGSSDYEASIVNCINYGTVSVPGSYSSSSYSQNYMGGIVGYNQAKEIRNCLSVGEVQKPTSVPSYFKIGSITGYSADYNWMSIEHCVWSSDVTGQDGFGTEFSYLIPSDCYDVEYVNETTMDDMNDYVTDGSKWVLSESYPVSLEVSGRKAIVYNANVILLFNSFTNAAGTYSGWYTDSDCQNLLDSGAITQTTLYGKWVPVYYTATFVFWEGNEKKESIGVGDIIELPTAIPEREHYIFDRWDSDYEMMPFKDITITAKWTPVTYYVTFDKNNGEEPVETPFAYNSTVTYPSVSRTGYKFIEWDKNIKYMPGENVTITAQWEAIYYTATFIILDDNEETKTYKYNDTIEPPTVPEREHYTFNGWNPKYETMPPRNITFTAQWKDILYQVIFDPNNGEGPEEKLYKYNETVEYPKNVYRTGYEFVEWDKNITYMPDENITITASWKIVYYTATFVDEDTNETKTYFYGNTIKYPEPAGKEGHEFDHWYPRYYKKMPARDMDFTAIYKPIKYTVFFVLGDEDLDQQIQVYFGYDVIYPDVTRTGYEFIEWDKNVTTMPAENVTVTALWKAIDYTLTFFEEDNQVIAVQTLHYEDPVFYPEVATKGTRKFDGWSLAITEMPASDVNITIKRKDIPTSQVKITAKITDKDRLEKMIDALTDKPFILKNVHSNDGITTGVVVFDDEVAAEAFMNKVVDELGEGSDAEIVCEYNYYEGYDEKAHREKNTASGAVSLVVSAVALFLAL